MNFEQVVKSRRSVRSFKKDPIPKDSLDRIFEAIRLSPSACNIQPYRFIIASDERIKDQISVAAKGKEFISQAPLVIVGCANPQDAFSSMGGSLSSWMVDLAIAFEHLVLAATDQELGTCWIGSFNEEMVKTILEVPDSWRVLALTPLGFPKITPTEQERKKINELISWNQFEA